MLEILDLYKKYKTKESKFELKIDLKIPLESFVVIEGESGSGKSTFAKIIAGLIPMNHGMIKLNGEDITSNLTNYVEYLEANEPLIDNFTVYQTLYAKCFHLYEAKETEKRIESVISSLKLTNLRDSKIHDLSGGEAQRVAVGCMLLSAKPILVLDEATHSLDENNAGIIVNILKEIKNKMVIYITHKVTEVEGIGDIYYHFEKGKIIETKEINQCHDLFVEIPSYNKTKVFSIVKNNFFTGIRGHLQTSISYLILFFLCSCFLAIGTFCTSINNEEVLCSPKTEYVGSDGLTHASYGVCMDSTKYYVEVHSTYNRKIYEDEIEELKLQFKAVDTIENQYGLSYQMLPDENGLYSLHLGAIQEKDLLAGRLYRNKKEAILAINETQFYTNREYYKSFIGTQYGEYTIVGIVQTPHDDNVRYIFYASSEDFESFKSSIDSSQMDSFMFYAWDTNAKEKVFSFEKADFLNCVIDNSLSNDTIATSKISQPKKLEIIYAYPDFYLCDEYLDCIPSEHLLSMNQSTYDKFVDERMVPCTYFYFNTFEECENFIEYLKSENISFTFTYYKYNQTIQVLSYVGAFILILVVYIIVGIINRRVNRNRDLFYNKCNYNKKKLWLAKIMSSTVWALISLGIYAMIYALLSQAKYTSLIMYYALRWMTVENWFILLGLALILHIGVEMVLQSLPRKRLR